MKLLRLFLISSLAFVALSGVAAAAEVPPALSSPAVWPTPISTTASPEGSLTTYSDGVQVFTPASPDAVSDCPSQYFCLWKDANFSGERVQYHDSGYWQYLPAGFQKQASSFYNNRNNSSYVAAESGAQRCFQAGGAGNFGAEWNDRAVEVYLQTYNPC